LFPAQKIPKLKNLTDPLDVEKCPPKQNEEREKGKDKIMERGREKR